MTAQTVDTTAARDDLVPEPGWTTVCRLDSLEPERGVAALVQGRQVALFRTWDGAVYALDHRDPFSGAHVMARGIVGTRGDVPTVASPMYKQVFDLRSGSCFDDGAVRLRSHDVRLDLGVVSVRLASGEDAAGVDLDDRDGVA